ncbi:MAG: radical SAM protein [Faecalibacterium sp.]|nr:radical SAM protein [Faecalibacterium sp.]
MKQLSVDALAQQCQQNTQLFNIMFVLLSRCNENCVHCYIPDHTHPGLPTETVKRLIDEARALGALNVTFTGGEILLRQDLPELIAYARSRWMRVHLMSNGVAMDEDYIRMLAQLHITNFSTTVFSMDPQVHDRITQVPGSLQKCLDNILLLHRYGIDVTVKTPLMEWNKYAYREVEQFARKYGFAFRTTTTIFGKTDGDSSPHALQIGQDFKTILDETDALNEVYRGNLKVQEEGAAPCSAGFSSICVNYDGTVWPCNTLTLDVGNVHKTPLARIWHEAHALLEWRQRAKLPRPVCDACPVQKTCIRCPGLAYMEDGDLYGCSASAKKLAEAR